MAFLVRPLSSMTLGASLKSLRKRQGISLDMVALQTRIQRKYLEALEADRHQHLPDPIYTRHLLGLFVEALHGNVDYYLSPYMEECGSCPSVHTAMRLPMQRIRTRLLREWRSMALRAGIAAAAILVVGYMGTQLYRMAEPPALLVDAPFEDMQTTGTSVEVAGQTEQEVQISVNGKTVPTDLTGRFSTRLTLSRGLNIIEIEAKKKYGRPTVVRRSVFLEEIGPLHTQPPLDRQVSARSPKW